MELRAAIDKVDGLRSGHPMILSSDRRLSSRIAVPCRAWSVALLLALSLRGCVAYEFEHEFWIRVDGSGTVNVTARPSCGRR
jgi:hypothetical protein